MQRNTPIEVDAAQSAGWLTVCAWCNRLHVRGRWLAVRPTADQPHVTHGICPACLDRALEDAGLG